MTKVIMKMILQIKPRPDTKRGDEKMEDLLKQILEEQKKTNELLKTQNKDPNELLTIKQIHEETGIGTNMIQKMFNDPELPVQKYTSPFKVTRQAFNNYINVKHDYLRSIKE